MKSNYSTINKIFDGERGNHISPYGEYIVIYTMYYDANILNQSNFEAIYKRMKAISDDDTGILHYNGFATGTHLLINPLNERLMTELKQIEFELEQYPIMDEELYSEYESKAIESYIKDFWTNDYETEMNELGMDKIEYAMNYLSPYYNDIQVIDFDKIN